MRPAIRPGMPVMIIRSEAGNQGRVGTVVRRVAPREPVDLVGLGGVSVWARAFDEEWLVEAAHTLRSEVVTGPHAGHADECRFGMFPGAWLMPIGGDDTQDAPAREVEAA